MTTTPAAGSRINSIDIIRGAVMVLMAIDHVRVYAGVPAGGPPAGVFFTRWVTHFCAPAFVFLAGTSAFLSGQRRTSTELSKYLLTRGAWLVLLELTVIRFFWTFNVDWANHMLAGVIWMLGWCMILMAGLVRMPVRTVGIVGLVIIFAQQLVRLAWGAVPESAQSSLGWLFQILYQTGNADLSPLAVLYCLVPWIGVMAAGYGFGAILLMEKGRRNRLCLRIGLSATALYLVVATAIALGQPAQEGAPPLLFRILGQQKYPASQLYLMMTLGPTIALIPVLERARGWLADALAVVGRVPFFYYLLHIPLIHLLAIAVSVIRTGAVSPWLFGNHPLAPGPAPDGYRWSLGLLYLVWLIAVVMLYGASSWYAKRRASLGWVGRYL